MAARVFFIGALVTSIIVGALQAFRIDAGMLTNYGADVFGTAWLYALFRQGKTIFQRGRVMGPEATALIVLAGCVGSEFGQKWNLVPGHFDAYDLLAFVVTVAICYGVDRRVVALA